MSNALAKLEALAHSEIEVGGLWFRVRPVVSKHMRDARLLLLALSRPSDAEIVERRDIEEMPDGPEKQARLEGMLVAKIGRQLTPERIDESEANHYAILAAGVTHVRDGVDGEWTAVQLVDTEIAEPPAFSAKALRHDVRQVLFNEIWRITTGGGGDSERLARFRGGS